MSAMTSSQSDAAMPKFVVAACQMLCREDKAANIRSAEEAVKDAAKAGAKVCRPPAHDT